MANFMGLAFMEEAFDFEVQGIKVEHMPMVVAFVASLPWDHIEEQLEVRRQVVQH